MWKCLSRKKIVAEYCEHKMEMAEGKITAAGKSGQLLEKIWHLNLLARDVLLKSDRDNEGIAEYVLRLISLTKELSRSLSQQLENVTESLQDTCHLLSALHDKHKELTASPGKYGGTCKQNGLGILDAKFCRVMMLGDLTFHLLVFQYLVIQ